MSLNFIDKLNSTILEKQSLLCVGLDPVVDRIPACIKTNSDPIFAFNKAIIDAVAEFTSAFKINTAFYEAYGVEGWRSLEATFNYLPESAIKIADAKRGDIGNTSRMYARAFFDYLNADAMTLNPYLGQDAIKPFLENPEKGAFILCITSNPGANDFQRFSDLWLPFQYGRRQKKGLTIPASQRTLFSLHFPS